MLAITCYWCRFIVIELFLLVNVSLLSTKVQVFALNLLREIVTEASCFYSLLATGKISANSLIAIVHQNNQWLRYILGLPWESPSLEIQAVLRRQKGGGGGS